MGFITVGARNIKVVAVSDTHGMHDAVGKISGDILIFAGDATMLGQADEYGSFNRWIASLDFAHKIIIPGNHDFFMSQYLPTGAIYSEAGAFEVEGLRIGCMAYCNLPNWAHYRSDVLLDDAVASVCTRPLDLLVTHCPPQGYLDRTSGGTRAGLPSLRSQYPPDKLLGLPALHVFGHIHEAAGVHIVPEGTVLANVSFCDEHYNVRRGVHSPLEIMF